MTHFRIMYIMIMLYVAAGEGLRDIYIYTHIYTFLLYIYVKLYTTFSLFSSSLHPLSFLLPSLLPPLPSSLKFDPNVLEGYRYRLSLLSYP